MKRRIEPIEIPGTGQVSSDHCANLVSRGIVGFQRCQKRIVALANGIPVCREHSQDWPKRALTNLKP